MQARKNKTGPKSNSQRNSRMTVLVAASALGLAAGAASADLVYRLAAVPHVGDIVAFDIGTQPSYGYVEGRVLAERPGQDGCALDPEAMRKTGGSLIVEERLAGRNPRLRAHWAGLRTAGDNSNCGADADLVLRASDMAILAAAAGGYGVVKPPVLPVSWMDAQVFP